MIHQDLLNVRNRKQKMKKLICLGIMSMLLSGCEFEPKDFFEVNQSEFERLELRVLTLEQQVAALSSTGVKVNPDCVNAMMDNGNTVGQNMMVAQYLIKELMMDKYGKQQAESKIRSIAYTNLHE